MVWRRCVGEDFKKAGFVLFLWFGSISLCKKKKNKKNSIRIHIKEESSQRRVSSQPGIREGFKVQLVFGIKKKKSFLFDESQPKHPSRRIWSPVHRLAGVTSAWKSCSSLWEQQRCSRVSSSAPFSQVREVHTTCFVFCFFKLWLKDEVQIFLFWGFDYDVGIDLITLQKEGCCCLVHIISH